MKPYNDGCKIAITYEYVLLDANVYREPTSIVNTNTNTLAIINGLYLFIKSY